MCAAGRGFSPTPIRSLLSQVIIRPAQPILSRRREDIDIQRVLERYRAVALEDTLDVDVFAPPRQDWLSGTDDYLRQK
jgi:hypothetical protein